MKKVILRYQDKAVAEEVVLIGPAEDMLSKRELAGKDYADSEYKLYFQTFLACKRIGSAGPTEKFEAWLERVDQVEPRLSLQEVDDLEAMGEVNASQAEYMRRRVVELGDADQGESPAPRS